MTPNDVKLALHEVLNNGVSLNASAYIVFIVGWVVAGGLGAFLGGYFGKRAETAAVSRDLSEIKEHLRQQTRATEEVRAEIAGDLWERQNRRTHKNDLYARLLVSLMEAGHAARQIEIAEGMKQDAEGDRLERITTAIEEYRDSLDRHMSNYRAVEAVAPIFLHMKARASMGDFGTAFGQVQVEAHASAGNVEYYRALSKLIGRAMKGISEAAQLDLGVSPDRS